METVVGTLPLVFGIHCFGCTTASISTFIEHANAHNVVLVLPQGIQNSFNARHCCGYALANEIDDVGFLKYIQSTLSDEYEFVQSDFSYAVGWSNGGFMVMHAASLFRSISPISGYIPEIDQSLTKGGTFCVDNICVDAPGAGKGIFLHHSVDDQLVRPTGCCNDPDLPKCCCNIAADTCSSVTDVASNWALEVNGCELSAELESDNGSDNTEDGDDEGDNGSKGENGNDEGKGDEEPAGLTGPKFVTSYSNTEKGIQCTTTTGSECKANTTICMHESSGHFNEPSFDEAFPFAKEVIAFFAKDACEINEGIWNERSGACACPGSYGGTFCLDAAEKTISIHQVGDGLGAAATSPKGSSHKLAFGWIFFAIAIWFAVRCRSSGRKKKVDRYFNDVRDEEMEEATELVSSSGSV